MNNKKVFITGVNGFVGSHLAEKLLNLGFKVKGVSRQSTPKNLLDILEHENFELIRTDILNRFDYDLYLKDVDIVVHLFWSNNPRNKNKFLTQDVKNSILTGIDLLNACAENGVEKFVFPSSGGTVYGKTLEIPINENHRTAPISSYGLTKLTYEKYLNYYNHQFGLDYNILRIANIYGPRQNLRIKQGVVSHWLKDIILEKKIELWGDGSAVRDYIYIDDLVDSIVKTLEYKGTERIFNIGSGVGVSLKEIIEIYREKLKLDFEIVHKEYFNTDVDINILDINKATKSLDWKPKTSLETGIKHTYEYLNKVLTD